MSAKYIGCIGTHAHGPQVMSLLCQSDVIITFRISAYSGTSGSLFLRINVVSNGEQEKESLIRVRVGKKNPSLVITVWHHSASLVMPNSDPRDRYFYPTLTLMIDSYNPKWIIVIT